MKKFIILSSITALTAVITAMAGTTGKIAGKITDKQTKEPLAGVNIVIDNTYLGASSDLDGDYFIINVPPGMHNISISSVGYQAQHIQDVRVVSDQTTSIDIQLVMTFVMGEEVIVIAERPVIEVDRTFSTSTVDDRDMEVMPITQISEVVEKQAGVVDGHFRGGRSGEVVYLLDGIPIQDNYDGSQSTQVNNSVVQELQVISGTFNAEYGQAMSGVVNMVTKEGSAFYTGKVSAEFGDYISTHDDVFMHIGDISPLGITNYEASLTGPVPRMQNTSFFLNGRLEDSDGWLYGQNRWELEHPVVLTDSGWTVLPEEGNGDYISMNPNANTYLYGKLMFQPTPKIKLHYSTLWSDRQYKDYDHYLKYIPEGDYHRFDLGRTNMIKMTHTLSNSMFYEAALSNTYSEYYHYVYENPYDNRYVHSAYFDVNPAYTLDIGGTKLEHFRRFTNTYTVQNNFSWQANQVHLLKSGFKFDWHRLYYNSFSTVHNYDYPEVLDPYTPAVVNFVPEVPPVSSIYNDRYIHNPVEAAFYLQDKIELKSFIVNLGMRFDYFDPDGKVLADPKDPNINNPLLPLHAADSLSVRYTYWYKDVKPKMQFSPRIGVAYPISDKGVLHFAYGHFFQRPKFEYLYTNPEFEMEYGTGLNTVMGNADLRVEKTVTYEFGLQQGLSEDLSLDVNLFLRDIRDLVSTDTIVATYEAGSLYTMYTNRDFGIVRGLTLALDKKYSRNVSGSIDYTFQIASGNASDPQDAYNSSKGDREPLKQMIPLDWDRRHTLNANVNYIDPNNWGASAIATLGSGLPYTTEENEVQLTIENDGRKPMYFNVDFSAFKDFILTGKKKITLSMTVKNLFDRLNENDVYKDTGRATYTEEPSLLLEVPSINTFEEFYTRPDYYSRPREVRIGVNYEF